MSGGFWSGGILARGDFVQGGVCPGGILSGGILSGGYCPGGYCPRIRVTTEVTGLQCLLPPLAAAKQPEDYTILRSHDTLYR